MTKKLTAMLLMLTYNIELLMGTIQLLIENEPSSNSFPWIKLYIGVLSTSIVILLLSMCSVTLYKRYNTFETLEDWELDCPHRFRHRDLHTATKEFKDSELIGVGGFGAVYKGVLPFTGAEVAVKMIVRGPIIIKLISLCSQKQRELYEWKKIIDSLGLC